MQPSAGELWSAPPRRRIYLMRHADVEYFDGNGRPVHPEHVPLTPRGREQADAAATALAAVEIDRVITSGLPRTVETTERVLAGRQLPVETDPRWREIETGKLGDVSALSPEMIRDAILGALPPDLSPDKCFLSGETFLSLHNRVTAAWRDLLARRDWGAVLIVAHGIINRTLLAHLLRAPLGALGKIEQDACCINLIESDDNGGALVRLVNYTPSNPLKAGMTLSTIEGLARGFLGGRRS